MGVYVCVCVCVCVRGGLKQLILTTYCSLRNIQQLLSGQETDLIKLQAGWGHDRYICFERNDLRENTLQKSESRS